MASPAQDPEAVRRGATIRALRQANGLTIAQLAAAAGVSRPYLTNVELGVKKAPPRLCRAIADALGIPLAAITAPAYAQMAGAK